jgi:hypothetical protein
MDYAVSIPVQAGDHLGVFSGASGFSPLYPSSSASDVFFGAVGAPAVGQTTGAPTSDTDHVSDPNMRVDAAATLTSPSVASAQPKKKCKKKKHKRFAQSAKKKKCKKHKKH